MKGIINYVCGFMFSLDMKRVALIEKLKPEFQKNKFNGIGGKIEEYDLDEYDSMIREFEEETGVKTFKTDWIKTVVYVGPNYDYEVHFFMCISDKIDKIKQVEKEKPIIVNVNELYKYPTLYNINWLVPISLDKNILKPIYIYE